MNNEQLQISLDNFINAFTGMLDRIPSKVIRKAFDADNVLHLNSIRYNEIVLLSSDDADITHELYVDSIDIDYPINIMVNNISDLYITIGGKTNELRLPSRSMINIIPLSNSDKKEYVLYVNSLAEIREVSLD